jgi:hypothetical protein
MIAAAQAGADVVDVAIDGEPSIANCKGLG